MPKLRIFTLGGLNLYMDQEPIAELVTKKVQALLVFLAIERDKSFTRDRIISIFWADSGESQARYNLRYALWVLRKGLGIKKEEEGYILAEGDNLRFNTNSDYWLDTEVMTRLLEQAEYMEPGSEEKIETLKEALSYYKGDFLEGFFIRGSPGFEDWVYVQRERFRNFYFRAVRELASNYLLRNQIREAIAAYHRLLKLDPLQEEVHQELMKLYYRAGDRNAALRQYNALKELLKRDLEAEPLEETQSLYRRILEGKPLEDEEWEESPKEHPRASRVRIPFDALSPEPQVSLLPFVGRKEELRFLDEAWEEARSGTTRVILISGETGVGKTRLLREFARRVRDQGYPVFEGVCHGHYRSMAYMPFSEGLKRYLRTHGEGGLSHLSRGSLQGLSLLVPDLLSEYLPRGMSPEQERIQLVEGFFNLMKQEAEKKGILITIDDLHWADSSSIELFYYLAVHLRGLPVMIVGTYRPEEFEDNPNLVNLLFSLRRSVPTDLIELPPLTEEETLELVRQVLGEEPARKLGKRIYAETLGNPLFIVSILENLSEWGEAIERVELPPSVRDVIRERVSKLNPEERKLLAVAAVLGESFSYSLLKAVYSGDEDRLLSALEGLLRRRFLEEEEGPNEEVIYRFHHFKVKDIVYEDLPLVRRKVLHQKAGEAIEQLYPDQLSEFADALAFHFSQSGQREKAVRYLILAGDQAKGLYSLKEALRFYKEALELEGEEGEHALYLHLEIAFLLSTLGQHEEAQRRYDALLSRSLPVEDSARVRRKMAYILARMGNYGAALQHLKTAKYSLEKAAQETHPEYFAVMRAIGWVTFMRGDMGRAIDLWSELLEEIKKNRRTRIREFAWEHAALHQNLAHAYMEAGEFHTAQDLAKRAVQLAEKAEAPWIQARALLDLGIISLRLGEAEKGRGFIEQAMAIYQRMGHREGISEAHRVLGLFFLTRGEFEGALKHFEQSLEIKREIGDRVGTLMVLIHRGETLLRMGRKDEAQAVFEEASTLNAELRLRNRVYTQFCFGMAHFFLALKDPEKAYQYLEELVEREEELGIKTRGILHRLLGQQAALHGDQENAEYHFERSMELLKDLGDPLEYAQTLKAYGHFLRDNPQGRTLLQKALAIFREIKAEAEIREIEKSLA